MEAEDDLVRRSRSGDRSSFARLIEMHQTIARRVATTMMGTGGEADDVVQDAFVKAFTRLDQFREGGSFRAWLLTIVANEARNRHRAAGRRATLALRVATRPDAADPTADPAQALEAAERRRRLADAVAGLGENDRAVIALRYFAELTEAETAAALGVPAGTVKSRLNRALGRLRSNLGEGDR
jgi:RNA polymerase sigma-70 factor (ECF subfamily)